MKNWVHSAKRYQERRTEAPSTAIWLQTRPCPATTSQGDVCVPRCVIQRANLSTGDAHQLPEILCIGNIYLTEDVMQSKFAFFFFFLSAISAAGKLLSPKRVQKRLSSLRRASDLFYARISLSPSRALSLSPSCSPLLFQTHINRRAHTQYYTHLNGRTPLVLYRLLLVRADEMKEQLASIASSNRSSLAGRQNASTATRRRRFSRSLGAVLRAPRALRHPLK